MNKSPEDASGDSRELLSEFPPHTYEQWKQAAIELLKGKPFEKLLITPTYEGFDLEPIQMRNALEGALVERQLPGMGNRVRGSRAAGYLGGGWLVSQELAAPTPEDLNALALWALENGQNELNLWIDSVGRSGRDPDAAGVTGTGVCGVSLATREDISKVMEGVEPDWISTWWNAGLSTVPVAALFFACMRERKVDVSQIRIGFENDPLGWLARHGTLPFNIEHAYDEMSALVSYCEKFAPLAQTVTAAGHVYLDGGSASHHEMAYVLAAGVEYLRALQARDVEPAVAARQVRLSLSVGSNFFIEIGKFRAMRVLWDRVLEAFGVAPEDRSLHLHARTALWNKTAIDPYANMLRTTTEAFAAAVGGCDSLHVGPFDSAFRESDRFAHRIARNTHHILAEECGMANVLDPAGGSWSVEWLTDKMAEQAWSAFQEVERKGGLLAALKEGLPQQKVAAVRDAQRKNVQRRKDTIVGTNNYPNPNEKPLERAAIDYGALAEDRGAAISAARGRRNSDAVSEALSEVRSAKAGAKRVGLAIEAAAAGATLGELFEALNGGATGGEQVEAIPQGRLSEDYEQLRARATELRSRPSAAIHQLNIGPSRRYRARADWTSAFFQVGGQRVINEDDYASPDEAVAALRDSNAAVAVITSDDETYAAQAAEVARAVKAACPETYLLLAGAPGEREAEWREAGVDEFVHVRVNNYELNAALLDRLAAQG